MAFSLVRLIHVTEPDETRQQTITNAEGRFRFVSVPAGDYQLLSLRIGSQPLLSPVLHVKPAESLYYELRSEPLPIQLPAVTVRAGKTCLGKANLAEDSELATLWGEARKGVETRRVFELRYRFNRSLRQDVRTQFRLRKDGRQLRVDTVVSEPDSVVVQERRDRARHEAAGYGQGNLLALPSEKELLADEFLQNHCLETAILNKKGAFGLRFRPMTDRHSGYDIRGTIWLDSASYQVRRIEYEHLDGGKPFSQVGIDYGDVRVGRTSFRLPVSGWATLRPRGPSKVLVSGASAPLTYAYWAFEESPAK